MNDDQLQFDRTCHVIYSKPCKAEIREKIAHHYPESQREAVWERVQMQYVDFLSDWRTDLGGKKNLFFMQSVSYRPRSQRMKW